jgi:hypothetical protein
MRDAYRMIDTSSFYPNPRFNCPRSLFDFQGDPFIPLLGKSAELTERIEPAYSKEGHDAIRSDY